MVIKEKLRRELANKMPHRLLSKLPASYSVTGDIAILRFNKIYTEENKERIGEALIKIDHKVKIVVEQVDTESIYRKPLIKHIAGERRTTTIHKEYGTKFHIDVEKLTFSPGNKGERGHLTRTVKKEETIIDMFACIGNLSLPICVKNPKVIIYGIEKNPVAFEYLKRNIKENKVEKQYHAILGDNREKTPKKIADRVLLGFFGTDLPQIVRAIEAIRDEGWIHYHFLAPRNTNMEIETFFEKGKAFVDFQTIDVSIRKIKKYSPRKYHYCADMLIQKSG